MPLRPQRFFDHILCALRVFVVDKDHHDNDVTHAPLGATRR